MKLNKLECTRSEAIELILDRINEGRSRVNALYSPAPTENVELLDVRSRSKRPSANSGSGTSTTRAASVGADNSGSETFLVRNDGWRLGARYAPSGITVSFVKEQIKAEVEEAGAFAAALFRASDLPPFRRITQLTDVGPTRDLVIDAEGKHGAPLRLIVACTVADRDYHKEKAWRNEKLVDPIANPGVVGDLILLAPRMFFEKLWSGEYPDACTFEHLRRSASPALAEVLNEAIARGEEKFQFIGVHRPRPAWALRRDMPR